MRPEPYIGVTGYMHFGEIEHTLSVIPPHSEHLFMIGVLMSNKSLRGVVGPHASNPKRYPSKAALEDIFSYSGEGGGRTLNLVHFNTSEPGNLFNDMVSVQSRVGAGCNGFQLNMPWPDRGAIERYRNLRYFQHHKIVLQCGREALAEVGNNAAKLVERVKKYVGIVNYVLIDGSMGTGTEFDLETTRHYLDKLSAIDSIGLVVAGGLHAGNVDRIEPILREFPGSVSVDAEGRLRDEDDNLSVLEAKKYLIRADELFARYERVST